MYRRICYKYTYDSLNQLKEEYDYIKGNYTKYTYDNGGNITLALVSTLSSTGIIGGVRYSKNYTYGDTDWTDKLTKYGTSTITYDAIGNPLNYRDGMSFTWKNGRLLTSAVLSDSTSVTYQYNYTGMRTKKTSGSTVTNYYYDSSNNLIGLKSGNDVAYFYYDNDNSPVSMKYNGTMYYYVKTIQGDIAKVLDSSGNSVASYTYDAWGNITLKSVKDTNIDTLSPFRYRGYVYDSDTGLYYLQSRYYDPTTGRFINADDTDFIGTTGTVLSTNLFAYCENNPFNSCDYSGNYTLNLIGVQNKKALDSDDSDDSDDMMAKKRKKKKSFTIIYKANGGEGKRMANTKVIYGKKTKLRTCGYYKIFYVFKGWAAYRKSDKKWFCYNKNNTSKRRWLTNEQIKKFRIYRKYRFQNRQNVARLSSRNNDKVYMYAQWSRRIYEKTGKEDLAINVILDGYYFPYRMNVYYTYTDEYYLSYTKVTYFHRRIYVSVKSTNNLSSMTFQCYNLSYRSKDNDILKRFNMKPVEDAIVPSNLFYLYYRESNEVVSYDRDNSNIGFFVLSLTGQYITTPWSKGISYSLIA